MSAEIKQTTVALGKQGEDAAVKFLKKNGYKIIERNFRTRYAEIDVVAKEGKTLVFIEVKTRSGTGFGTPAEAVGYAKQQKIIMAATEYLAKLRKEPLVRFDVASVIHHRGSFAVDVIKNAFDSGNF